MPRRCPAIRPVLSLSQLWFTALITPRSKESALTVLLGAANEYIKALQHVLQIVCIDS